jgi:hypothetical protein
MTSFLARLGRSFESHRSAGRQIRLRLVLVLRPGRRSPV